MKYIFSDKTLQELNEQVLEAGIESVRLNKRLQEYKNETDDKTGQISDLMGEISALRGSGPNFGGVDQRKQQKIPELDLKNISNKNYNSNGNATESLGLGYGNRTISNESMPRESHRSHSTSKFLQDNTCYEKIISKLKEQIVYLTQKLVAGETIGTESSKMILASSVEDPDLANFGIPVSQEILMGGYNNSPTLGMASEREIDPTFNETLNLNDQTGDESLFKGSKPTDSSTEKPNPKNRNPGRVLKKNTCQTFGPDLINSDRGSISSFGQPKSNQLKKMASIGSLNADENPSALQYDAENGNDRIIEELKFANYELDVKNSELLIEIEEFSKHVCIDAIGDGILKGKDDKIDELGSICTVLQEKIKTLSKMNHDLEKSSKKLEKSLQKTSHGQSQTSPAKLDALQKKNTELLIENKSLDQTVGKLSSEIQ